MTALVRAEWTKLFTTRVWIGLLLGACVMVAGFTVLLTAFAGDEESGLPPVGTEVYEELAFATAANVVVLFLILGIIGMTQEYRHRTATPTFLTTPRRGRVVVAKLVGYALAAVPMALVACAKASCSNVAVPTGGIPLSALPAKAVSSAVKPPTMTHEPSSRPSQTRVVNSLVHSDRTSRIIGRPPG